MRTQELVLVNENDQPIGTMDKMEVHEKGLLHRAFSVFIFNNKGEMLLQQRAEEKYHSPELWTNACCSHPLPDEEVMYAASRRLKEELGFSTKLEELFSFIYRAEFDNGLIEHEYDHVFTGIFEGQIIPDPSEVKDYVYKNINEIAADLNEKPETYTPWFRIAFPEIYRWTGKNFGIPIENILT